VLPLLVPPKRASVASPQSLRDSQPSASGHRFKVSHNRFFRSTVSARPINHPGLPSTHGGKKTAVRRSSTPVVSWKRRILYQTVQKRPRLRAGHLITRHCVPPRPKGDGPPISDAENHIRELRSHRWQENSDGASAASFRHAFSVCCPTNDKYSNPSSRVSPGRCPLQCIRPGKRLLPPTRGQWAPCRFECHAL